MKNILKFTLIIFLIVSSLYTLAKLFSPGLYPNAEVFIMEGSDSLLIKKINALKTKDSFYNVPQNSNLTDGLSSKDDKRFIYYFYYQKENEIIFTWIRSINKTQCQFALVSIKSDNGLGNWKDLNKDLGYFETKDEVRKFKERILIPLNISFKKTSFLDILSN